MNLMIMTNQTPIIDTHTKRKKSKCHTKGSHQITGKRAKEEE